MCINVLAFNLSTAVVRNFDDTAELIWIVPGKTRLSANQVWRIWFSFAASWSYLLCWYQGVLWKVTMNAFLKLNLNDEITLLSWYLPRARDPKHKLPPSFKMTAYPLMKQLAGDWQGVKYTKSGTVGFFMKSAMTSGTCHVVLHDATVLKSYYTDAQTETCLTSSYACFNKPILPNRSHVSLSLCQYFHILKLIHPPHLPHYQVNLLALVAVLS